MVTVPRFFVSKDSISGSAASVAGDDARHITRSLRMKPGEALTLCDGHGTDYDCRIVSLSDSLVTLQVEGERACVAEPTVDITLFMALPKGDKMDYVIQKAVELGVSRIVPYSSARCIVRLSDKDKPKKQERWSRIALEAAKQCGRGIIPPVAMPHTFGEMISRAKECDLPLFFYESERETSLKAYLSQHTFKSAAVIIGPEGGFDAAEAERIVQAGIPALSLGPRILRCETAPGCAITAIMYETDNI